MDHLDARSQELFGQYRLIASKLKKRFMKKPNIRQASNDYSKVANALKNEENHEYAALCFTAMAKCDQMMNDPSGEAEAWANAGRQFIAAEDKLFSARHPSYWDSLDAAIHCFMLAIEAHVKHKNDIMAAMYCLEIAHKLKYFKKYHEALTYFQRAVGYQTEQPECMLQTMEEVVSCKIRLREYDGALFALGKIGAECRARKGETYSLLKQKCEVSQLVLLLMLQYPRRYLSKEYSELLAKYSRDLLDPKSIEPLMNPDLYILLQSLIISCESKNFKEIKAVQPLIWKHLDSEQQHLFLLLVEVYDPGRTPLL